MASLRSPGSASATSSSTTLGSASALGALSERLEAYGLRIDPLAERADLSNRVGDLTAEMRLVIATGNAGDGKSAVLHQVVERLSAASAIRFEPIV